MNHRLRSIYLFIFIIFFLITAPLLLFYSMGYRYDFNSRQIWQTGSLLIETKPKKAQVFINNEPQNDLTPTLLKNLKPGSYHVKVEKMGYSNWSKELTTKPQLVTLAEYVYLFKENMPPNYLINNVQKCQNSPNQQKAVCLNRSNDNQYKVNLIDLGSRDVQVIHADLEELSYSQWSFDNELVLFKNLENNDYLILNTIDPGSEVILLSNLIQSYPELNIQNINKIHWDTTRGNILYILQEESVYSLNINNSELVKIISIDNIHDFLIDNSYIYYLTDSTEGKFALYLTSLDNYQDSELLLGDLDVSLDYQLTKVNHQIIYLFNKNNQLLVLIEKGSSSIRIDKFSRQVRGLHWSGDFKKLLYWNDFEICYYDLEEDTKELITRYSQEINTAVWHPDYAHVIFSLTEAIKVIELDPRDQHNIANLSNTSSDYLSIDSRGKNIFYLNNNSLVWQEIQ